MREGATQPSRGFSSQENSNNFTFSSAGEQSLRRDRDSRGKCHKPSSELEYGLNNDEYYVLKNKTKL